MNTTTLTGRLARDPELRCEGSDTLPWRMRLSVPCRTRSGDGDPGVAIVSIGYMRPRRGDFLAKG